MRLNDFVIDTTICLVGLATGYIVKEGTELVIDFVSEKIDDHKNSSNKKGGRRR